TNSSLTRRELLAASAGLAAATALPAADAQVAPVPNMPTSSRELWQWVRTQPMLDTQVAYLDVASSGPTLRAAMASEYRAREAQSLGLANAATRWTEETNRLATRFAAFLGCDADELLFTRGAGEALGLAIAGLDLAPGDEIITTTREHPAALSPWLVQARRREIVVKQIELPAPLTGPEQPLGLFAGAVTERTKVIAFSHVQHDDGAVLPVKELSAFARQKGILSIVDGAQALGMLEFSMHDLGCDLYATCGHKWLSGSHGTGALYVRREVLDELWPVEPRGLDSVPPVFTPTDADGNADVPAALHKLGNIVPYAWPALRGAEAALEFQQTVGRSKIEARIRELAIYARLRLQQVAGIEMLTPARPGLWAGILTFRAPGKQAIDLASAIERSHRAHVRVVRLPNDAGGALRLSPHIFSTHDDIEKLVQGLQLALR
ncbi:MAG TPA: aminotransferase class V-fold PLP-dependent enzyme, partial [Steroidobacteraceae bacterium]|nr:aminotransferase class V-fold PLP-dependent enzyme [Steroidobacteraceae bacterium]